MPGYVSYSKTSFVLNARDSAGKLVAFDIADFGAKHYAFYMFNCRSRQHHVPGTSDLLLQALIKEAEQQGKTYVNLGLGINQGVAFFKKNGVASPSSTMNSFFTGLPPLLSSISSCKDSSSHEERILEKFFSRIWRKKVCCLAGRAHFKMPPALQDVQSD
jgi:hypothetical protein